jgi:predicted esterase
VSWSRREFLSLIAATAGSSACGIVSPKSSNGNAGLSARPGTPTGSAAPGLTRLGSGGVHDGYLYVPAGYHAASPAPLVLALHGAGGNVTGPLALLEPYAESKNFLIVAVNSSDYTWDGIIGSYGPDVAIINTALQRAFAQCNVDPARVVLEGFSDGASYCLGLGLANGDLFKRLVAFSPGFIHDSDSGRHGKPEIFDSHGRQDSVLPIDSASRAIVAELRADGYTVDFREFDGGHEVPPDIAAAAVDWLTR